MIDETTFYVISGILTVAILVLLGLFFNLLKKTDASAEEVEKSARAYTNNKFNELDNKTPKFHVDGNGEVELRTPDGKYPIHYWKLDKTEKKK